MKKIEAMEEADAFYMKTGRHAHVVSVGGTYEWYSTAYFENGTDRPMRIVYNTWDTR